MKKSLINSFLYLSILSLVLLSCKKDEKEVIPAPTANFTFAADAADASKIKFTNASTNFSSVSWNFGDQSAAVTEQNPTHTYAAPGTYKVELSVLGKNGSTVKSVKEVTIAPVTVPAPTADFTFTADAANASMIKFTNTSTNFNSVSWNFGDESAAVTEENPTHTYAATGTYKVELTVVGKDGSTIKATKDVKIGDGEEPTSVIVNGDFATADNWTAVNIKDRAETTHTIADGVLTFTGIGIVNKLIYQEVELEAGEYQFSAHVKGDGSAIYTWLEFYLLDAKPPLTDLEDPSNAFLGWKTFDACINNVIDGKVEATESCTDGSNKNGKISVATAKKYYLGIKAGAWENGTLGTGVIIDNVSLIKL